MRKLLLSATAVSVMSFSGIAYGEDADQTNVIRYGSGGIGNASQELIESNVDAYNLKITVAYDSGHYLSDVPLIIKDEDGDVLVQTMTQGPIFIAEMPVGTYQIMAQKDTVVKEAEVTINESTQLRDIVFHWETPTELKQELSSL